MLEVAPCAHPCAVLLALIVSFALPGAARADQQRDPELKELLQRIIGSADCFADKYESEVWYKSMEPRLAQFVPTHDERVEILDHVYCEAKRDPTSADPAGPGARAHGSGKPIRPLGRFAGRRSRPDAGDAILAARAGCFTINW